MTVDSAISLLRESGLCVRDFPSPSSVELMALGDTFQSNGLDGYHWASHISDCGAHVTVTFPQLPGPDFIVDTLEQAVSLTIYAYDRRTITNGLSGRSLLDGARRIYEVWQSNPRPFQ